MSTTNLLNTDDVFNYNQSNIPIDDSSSTYDEDRIIRRRRLSTVEEDQQILGSPRLGRTAGSGERLSFPQTPNGLRAFVQPPAHNQMAPLGEGNTRFNCSSFHLTYPSHVPFDLIKSTILAKTNTTFEWYSMCHELGTTEVAYPHTHVAFKVAKKLNFVNPRYFDITHESEDEGTAHVIHPNIARIEKTSHAILLYWQYHRKSPIAIEQSETNPGTHVLNVLVPFFMTYHWESVQFHYHLCEYYDNIIHNIYENSNNCSLTCTFLNKPLIN